ncbi:MAG: hypothetical protein HW416_3867, partial [Chloroflexi bacterium]|nr:hypothetical protein [Chloroflexota bacterium]
TTCLRLYRASGTSLLDAITAKELFAVLKTTNQYRNEWAAHGGAESDDTRKQQLSALESELTRLRGVLADGFEYTELLRAGGSEYLNGVFRYSAKRLIGPNPIFRSVSVETTVPMEKDGVYLLDKDVRAGLEVAPLFRIMISPKKEAEACYFYNRIDRDSVRWVSYHFEQEASVDQPDEALRSLIRDLDT